MLRANINILRCHNLSNGQQAMFPAGLRHHNQAFHTDTLEAVRTRPRLKCAAAQHLAAGSLDEPGNFIDLFRRLNSAWSTHNDEVLSADLNTADINNSILGMEVTAGQLVGFGDFHDILYALHLPQMLSKLRCNSANQPDYSMICSP
ncbi:hypothetical protein D3C75_774790 [compost metagenome]